MSDLVMHALQFHGTSEVRGRRSDPTILGWIRRLLPRAADDSTTAWCAIFMHAVASDLGYEAPDKGYAAKAWETVGEAVLHLDAARQGDVVVLTRGARSDWRRHVGLLVRDDRSNGCVHLLGGNQNNRVCIETFGTDGVTAVRRLRRTAD